MAGQQVLIEIRPEKIKLTYEPKKHSSCAIKLFNRSIEFVAFKVKTTNPKRYCVQPNSGIILPRATREFTVTMLAQREAPDKMQIKDKFLVQGTVVPFGSTDEDIVSTYFSKESGRYIQENKMGVVLVSPTQVSETLKQEPSAPSSSEETYVPNDESMKTGLTYDNRTLSTSYVSHNETKQQEPPSEAPISRKFSLNTEATKLTPNSGFPMPNGTAAVTDQAEKPIANIFPTYFSKDAEESKKLHSLKFELNEADKIIARLKLENKIAMQEREKLQKQIVTSRRTLAGFPFLFVVFTALFNLVLGYLLHP